MIGTRVLSMLASTFSASLKYSTVIIFLKKPKYNPPPEGWLCKFRTRWSEQSEMGLLAAILLRASGIHRWLMNPQKVNVIGSNSHTDLITETSIQILIPICLDPCSADSRLQKWLPI